VSRSLNVVVVNSELPYPPTAGNRIRTLNLVLRLARRHRITLIAHRNPDAAEAEQAVAFLAQHGIEAVLADRGIAPRAGPMLYARLAVNLFSTLPYTVASHTSDAVRRAVLELAARHRVDLWQAESTIFMNALHNLVRAPKLVNAQNVESLIWQRYYETEQNPLKCWYIKQQWRKFERFERRAFAEATQVIAVSAEDALLIRERFGGQRVDVVDNGIDRAYFEAVRAERDPCQILFLGSLDWRPNLDAVGLLLDRILPMVLAEEPSARLCLVGRKPPEPVVRRVRELDQVELHADVPDIRPYLARSGVMVVPLRIGGGSRLKILEALATGLPVVSTCVGAEGLELEPGRDFMEADTVDEMVRTLIACLRDPGPAQAQAARVRRFVLDRYDWDMLATKLESIWLECAETLYPTPSEAHPR
jgi:glycosyltransferase involved in cell wall biosynthesis